ncbi:hypothetical protein [Hymenobacter pini]|uniref:hypothetical protein n=1 Tax=Hymenobacter pini TaxID=2880879 RepID=UPI001CF51F24|nr:hypothetical protein [Hymenobacter pini]MCA8830371.1 hypothetical protein [Hymenobacter pini]
MGYFHDILLLNHFREVRRGFYTKSGLTANGGPLYCLVGESEYPRQLLLWQAHRVLLQGDVVTKTALQQVLDKIAAAPTSSRS